MIIFKTQDEKHVLNRHSGISCPDGYAVMLCGKLILSDEVKQVVTMADFKKFNFDQIMKVFNDITIIAELIKAIL